MKHIKPTTKQSPSLAADRGPFCYFCYGVKGVLGKDNSEAGDACEEKGKCP